MENHISIWPIFTRFLAGTRYRSAALALLLGAGSLGCEAALVDGAAYSDQWPQAAPSGASELPVSERSTAQTVSPAAAPAGLRFSIGKWLNAEGTERALVSGGFDSYRAELSRPLASLADDLTDLVVTVTIDTASLNSGSALRDQNIRTAYFEVESYPAIKFALANLVVVGTGTTLSGSTLLQGDASVEIHGQTQSLQGVVFEVSESATEYRVKAPTAILLRADLGTPVPALLALCQHFGIDSLVTVFVDVSLPKT